jgi:hypothetical protein
VDNRLFKIETRPGLQRRQDLPLLARALVAVFRKQGQAKTGFVKNVGYVRLETPEFHVQVLASDWAKILPYIQSDVFNQVVVKSQIDSVWIDPLASLAPPIIDRTDRQYYLRVLEVLQGLFPTAYPTSTL